MARKSYQSRSRSNTQAAAILAHAFSRKIEFTRDADGNDVRVWLTEELQTYKNTDIVDALKNRRAHERHELLAFIPPTAVKYCMTKGWLWEDRAGLFWVTVKAADELKLPRKVNGLSIKFLKMEMA